MLGSTGPGILRFENVYERHNSKKSVDIKLRKNGIKKFFFFVFSMIYENSVQKTITKFQNSCIFQNTIKKLIKFRKKL